MVAKLLNATEIASNRAVALATYRHLLRAINTAFRNDEPVRKAAHQQARQGFRRNRKLDNGGPDTATGIEHAQGVAQILREHVVQGRNTGGDSYRLNIHKDTQRLDNTTATQLKGTKKSFSEIKNAQL